MLAYIAGKMTGEPNWGFDLFDAAGERCSEYGWEYISPADMDRAMGFDGSRDVVDDDFIYQQFRGDMAAIASADAIVLLENWDMSKGARHEAATGLFCGHKFYIYIEDEDIIIEVDDSYVRETLATPLDPAITPQTALLPDTVASTPIPPKPPIIIGLGHYARVGKDVVADHLVRFFGFDKQGFTDPLNAVLRSIDPIVADVVDEIGWERAKDEHPWVRERQQALGVAARNHIGEDVWVDALASQWQPGGRYVVKNVRFPNEARRILDAGGHVYRVDRPGYGPVNGHISETALEGFPDWSGTITNNASENSLRSKVESIMDALGISPLD